MSTKEATSTELAVVNESIVLSPDLTNAQLEQIRDVLTGQAEYEVPEADSTAISTEILNKILFAESEEEMLAEVQTWSSKDHIGDEFRIFPAGRLWPSGYINKDTGRKGAFLSVQALHVESGELGVLNTSSPRIVGKFVWYAQHKALPATFQIVQRGESSSGFPILDVDKAS